MLRWGIVQLVHWNPGGPAPFIESYLPLTKAFHVGDTFKSLHLCLTWTGSMKSPTHTIALYLSSGGRLRSSSSEPLGTTTMARGGKPPRNINRLTLVRCAVLVLCLLPESRLYLAYDRTVCLASHLFLPPGRLGDIND